jgi:inward rectifier potassium channel
VNNRWFHRPALHVARQGRERRVSHFERFFDLLVAGDLVLFAAALGHRESALGFAQFVMGICAVWQAFTALAVYQNRFAVDDLLHRALMLAGLVALGTLAVGVPDIFTPDTKPFSIGYAVTQTVLAVVYVRTRTSVAEARQLTGWYTGVHVVNAAVWLAAAFFPSTYTPALWSLGLALGFSFPLNRRSRELALANPPDLRHLTERYHFFTLALLAESLVSVMVSASGWPAREAVAPLAVGFVLTFSLFWLYFDDIAGATLRAERAAPFVWLYAHLPLAVGLVGVGAGMTRIVRDAAMLDVIAPAARWMVAGGLALSLFSMALLDTVTERGQADLDDRARVNTRLGAAVLTLLLGSIGAAMRPTVFLAVASVPCLAQIVFDLMMAPVDGETTGVATPTAEIAAQRLSGVPSAAVRVPRYGEPVRKGTPSELRKDFYAFFMAGPWSRLVLSLAFLYVAANAFFAGLYLLEPGSIGNARPDSFADAFYFSVQTFSTIGYGALTPATTYGNLVVAAEAACGLLGAAFATGLMFAKAARPRSSTLFSRTMIVTVRNGVPCLVFRVGNARGNDIVDATISVTALREEVTQEGHHMRRQHDVRLVRERSPFFTMTWTVIHELVPGSPLHDVDWANPKDLVSIVCTLVGHDGTYGQTTYARHIYLPEDVRVGHRFVDVMSQLEDGRFLIDYARFHDTEADPTALPTLPASADES